MHKCNKKGLKSFINDINIQVSKMKQQLLSIDYFMTGLHRKYQTDPFLILALTGRLNSQKGASLEIVGMYSLNDERQIVTEAFVLFDCVAAVRADPFDDENIIHANGTPMQCFKHLISQFQKALHYNNDSIYCEPLENPSFTDNGVFHVEK